MTAHTLQHPQVIEAQSRVQQLQSLLEQTPREPARETQKAEPAPALRGPDQRESARNRPQATVRLVSSAGDSAPTDSMEFTKHVQQLTAQWASVTARRTAAERSYNDAQQQWVRGLNSEGWEASTVWTQSQQGGRTTPFQLLLAGMLAVIGGAGMWRLVLVAGRAGLLGSSQELQEHLPLPVLGEVPLTTALATKRPAALNVHVLHLSQLSLAIVLSSHAGVCVGLEQRSKSQLSMGQRSTQRNWPGL